MIALGEEVEKMREEDEKSREEEERSKEVDEENNSIPLTPVRKILSRTSSFEVIRSKTIVMEGTNTKMERTTMNITSSPKERAPVELTISVRPPAGRPAVMVEPEVPPRHQARLTREVRVLPSMVLPMVRSQPLANGGATARSPPLENGGSGGGELANLSPASHQKPPLPQRSPTDPPSSQGTLSRSNSIGTQTPKIKARTQVFFDEGASSSEDSLEDSIAREDLKREVDQLRRELEGRREVVTGVEAPSLP